MVTVHVRRFADVWFLILLLKSEDEQTVRLQQILDSEASRRGSSRPGIKPPLDWPGKKIQTVY